MAFPRWLKPAVFAAALLPLAWLAWRAGSGGLGANPIEATTRFLGDWALNMLLVALAVSPLRRLTGRAEIARLRRMLGLFAFFYAALHVLSYVGLDQFFAWGEIWKDVVKRRYITAGMVALLILLALAATSPKRAVRALGGRAWKRLHALVYVAAPLAVLHYFWMVKADVTRPLLYAAILAVLLGERVLAARRGARPVPRAVAGGSPR
ncbi:sulfite oxidase heme-binding subunit YedZ [Novispirillum sp. DQ9]|uniref:sulfite oxidase heme-binding subunit YedZ n=1 Tax=Novispirillum sp. DQ9 TaxID=3398612 RepID=UPI003C7A6907